MPISLFPCYWLAVMASGTTQDIYSYPPKLVPGPHLLDDMGRVLDTIDFFGSLWNTIAVAVVGALLVPQFVTMAEFGWAGSLKALIIPGAANAFGVFWMRQYAQNSFIGLWNDYIWPLIVMINIGARHFLRDLAAGGHEDVTGTVLCPEL